ncbi:porin [Chitinimonas sp. BJB300]|uniref:porin n=1 Tax=Chitinimonas sp. BJB300 TaxID=1559339 RepID=UPI000C113203|nr:porin [Chitinimonas sp. BJB300]PHV12248.1 hypothetical protein CSQ89_06565 [Chitinimonas sp. BJB300]TSJ84760.1 porin [Chitinimonas sp. BJB300]
MLKRVMIAAVVAAAFSAPAFAGLNLGGTAELNFVYDKGKTEYTDNAWRSGLDRAIVINIDGETKLDTLGSLNFRVSQKVAEGDRTPAVGSREAWVGLTGDWGTFRGGRQFLNSYLTLDWPYGQGGFWELAERDLGNWGGSGKVTAPIYMSQSLNYLSPKMGGFSYSVQYAWAEKSNDAKLREGATTDISLNYAAGDLSLNGGFLTAKGVNNFDGKTDQSDKDQQYYFGATYNVGGGLLVRGLYTGYEHKSTAGDKAKGSDLITGLTYSWAKHYVKLGLLHRVDKASMLTTRKDFNLVKAEYGYSLASNVVGYMRVSQKKWGKESMGKGESYTQFLTGVWAGF